METLNSQIAQHNASVSKQNTLFKSNTKSRTAAGISLCASFKEQAKTIKPSLTILNIQMNGEKTLKNAIDVAAAKSVTAKHKG